MAPKKKLKERNAKIGFKRGKRLNPYYKFSVYFKNLLQDKFKKTENREHALHRGKKFFPSIYLFQVLPDLPDNLSFLKTTKYLQAKQWNKIREGNLSSFGYHPIAFPTMGGKRQSPPEKDLQFDTYSNTTESRWWDSNNREPNYDTFLKNKTYSSTITDDYEKKT